MVRLATAQQVGHSPGEDVQQQEQPHEQPQEQREDSLKTKEVTLYKGEGGFGFGLKAKDQPGPLTVGRVKQDGAAAKEPLLKKGVRVLELNGNDTTSITKRDAGRLLGQAGDVMRLVIVVNE